MDASKEWITLLRRLVSTGSNVRSRGLLCIEKLAHESCVSMTRPVVTVVERKIGYRFMAAEAWWILSGRNDVESIKPYSRHIASFSNDGVYFDGAYGPRVVDQLRYVCDSIEKDRGTRQAVIEIWRPNPRDSMDVPCTLTVQWLVRDGLLHCVDSMRSSDTWLGWPYDVFNFSMLSAYILLLLRSRCWKGGDAVNSWFRDIKLGNLYLVAGSQHLYVNPKSDGAYNIPYSISDVDRVLSVPELPIECVEYAALDVDEFRSPRELIDHLESIANKKELSKKWMRELL